MSKFLMLSLMLLGFAVMVPLQAVQAETIGQTQSAAEAGAGAR